MVRIRRKVLESSPKNILLLPLILSISSMLFLCHIQVTTSQDLKSFGEECDADCDERQLLVCSKNSSVCECMQPNSMHFDKEQDRCVGRAGFPCVRYGSDHRCIQHASCNRTTKLCSCEKGYFETENGTTCSIMAKYGDPCSGKRPCDRRGGMACLERPPGSSSRSKRTCQCMFQKDQFYDEGQGTCVSYAGGNCSFTLPCVRNADCSEDIYELRQGENIHGKSYSYNVTVGRKCACKPGTKQTKDRQCLRTYLEPCDLDSSSGNGGCNPEENLSCHDSSICLCNNPLTQIYDSKRGKCVSLVGSKCNDGETNCVSNAFCNSGRCECNEAFSSSPFQTCLKDFGKDCKSRDDDDDDDTSCNIYRGLRCHEKSGTCGCIDEDNLEYDKSTKTCQSREEGGPCGNFEYSDSSGFISTSEFDESEMMMMMMTMTTMGNHNREVMVGRGSGNGGGSAPSVSNGNGNGGGVAHFPHLNHNIIINGSSSSSGGTSASSVLPMMHFVNNAQNRGKLLHQFQMSHQNHHLLQDFGNLLKKKHKIRIRCGEGLECVNEFSGERMRSGNDIFQGFCRKRQ